MEKIKFVAKTNKLPIILSTVSITLVIIVFLVTNYSFSDFSLTFLETRYKGCRLTDIVGSPSHTVLSDYDYVFLLPMQWLSYGLSFRYYYRRII